jgi:two-component system cell cycle response regulator
VNPGESMPARILIIEDNSHNLELMAYLLGAFGHVTLRGRDGEEGLEIARRERPDMIICDLQMPKLDGIGVAREIRQDPSLAATPLIAVTAFAMRGDREAALKAGFDGYISKPIVPEEFVGQVEAFLPATPIPAHELAPVAPVAPRRRPRILVVDNSPVNLILMRSTLEPFGYHITTASSVKEGLDLARENPPDMILSDLHMPELSGFEFLKIVTADSELSTIPFALISSTVLREAEPSIGLALGARKFILRPIDPADLVAEVEAVLAESRG